MSGFGDFWGGTFSPLRKHRDYEHATYYEHLLANGITPSISPYPLWCDVEPITETEMDEPVRYYIHVFTFLGKKYPYLIAANEDGSEPNDEEVKRQMDLYCRVTSPLGRDINNYIDFERGIHMDIFKFMIDNDLGDKIDFRWTSAETTVSPFTPQES